MPNAMKTYQICDISRPMLEAMPIIEASSPKKAAEIYLGTPAQRVMGHYARLVVTDNYSGHTYLYNPGDPR